MPGMEAGSINQIRVPYLVGGYPYSWLHAHVHSRGQSFEKITRTVAVEIGNEETLVGVLLHLPIQEQAPISKATLNSGEGPFIDSVYRHDEPLNDLNGACDHAVG